MSRIEAASQWISGEQPMIILVDMDGVLCDFVACVCEMFGKNPIAVQNNWKPGNYDICPEIDVSPEKLWEKVEEEGEDLWANLKPYPWAREMYDWLKAQGDVIILTQPTLAPSCLAGKLRWLYEFTGDEKFRDFVMTPRKDAFAVESRILIDDSDKNIEKFQAACPETKTILFPQPWNRMHGFRGDKFTHVRYLIHKILPLQ